MIAPVEYWIPPSGSAAEWRCFHAIDLHPVRERLEPLARATGVELETGAPFQLSESLFDTRDWRLHRAGLSLKATSTVGETGRRTAYLESLVGSASGFAPSLLAAPLEAGSRAGSELRSATEGELFERVRLLTGTHRLERKFDLELHGWPIRVVHQGRPVARIILEETRLPWSEGRPSIQFSRVLFRSFDTPRGGSRTPVRRAGFAPAEVFLESLAEVCGLIPDRRSRLDTTFLATGLDRPEFPDLGPTDPGDDPTVGELAFAVLRDHFGSVLRHEPGTRLGDDLEELHRMRVGIRRFRSTLGLFRDCLPRRLLTLEPELRWLGQVLGPVRDLDVQLENLTDWEEGLAPTDRESLEVLRGLLSSRRDSERVRMVRSLDSPRHDRLIERVIEVLRLGPAQTQAASQRLAREVGPGLLRDLYDGLVRRGKKLRPRTPAAKFHKLRIRVKKLRYAIEIHRDLYGRRADSMVRRVVKLQDHLGDHQDADIAVEELESLVEQYGAELPPRAVFVMGSVAESHRRTAARLRKRFDRPFSRIRGRVWKRLERRMSDLEKIAVESAPAVPEETSELALPFLQRGEDTKSSAASVSQPAETPLPDAHAPDPVISGSDEPVDRPVRSVPVGPPRSDPERGTGASGLAGTISLSRITSGSRPVAPGVDFSSRATERSTTMSPTDDDQRSNDASRGDASRNDSRSPAEAASGEAASGADVPRTEKSEAEWRELLDPETYHVTREKGTERPFSGKYSDTTRPGTYRCRCCNLPLFRSDTKFEAGCGWPSFFEPLEGAHLAEHADGSHGMVRTEVTCAGCGAHLGHVFNDGPPPTGLRYCINSVCLDLEEE